MFNKRIKERIEGQTLVTVHRDISRMGCPGGQRGLAVLHYLLTYCQPVCYFLKNTTIPCKEYFENYLQ